jgi:hypothetical protein
MAGRAAQQRGTSMTARALAEFGDLSPGKKKVIRSARSRRMKMSIPCKSERSQLSHEEFEMVSATHHPAIYDLAGNELHALKQRLCERRDKARALARQKQREMRGKSEPRGKSFPGTADQPRKRKQIFAAALKRINRELDRLHKLEARTAQVKAARAALAPSRRKVRTPSVGGSYASCRRAVTRQRSQAHQGCWQQDRERLAGNQGRTGYSRRKRVNLPTLPDRVWGFHACRPARRST